MKRMQMTMAALALLAANGLTTMASAGLYDMDSIWTGTCTTHGDRP
jgi:hypothetical protein